MTEQPPTAGARTAEYRIEELAHLSGATVRTMTNVNVLSVDRRTFQTLVAHIAPLREAFERLMRHREAADKARRQEHEEERAVC